MSDLEQPPSGWWWNPDVDTSALKKMLSDNNGRLTSLSVRSVDPVRFAAVWVARGTDDKGADWSPDIDPAALGAILDDKAARITCLQPYVKNGKAHFAAAWVPNKGVNATAWWWNPDVSPSDLGKMLTKNKGRLICLNGYTLGGSRHYAAVWVDNTGTKNIPWWWNPDVDIETLGGMLEDNQGRLVCIDPFMSGGKLRFSAAWVQNTDAHAKGWWWYHGLGAETLGHKVDLFCAYQAELKTYAISAAETHLACVMYAYPEASTDGPDLIEVTGSATLVSQSNSMAPLDQDQRLSITIKNKTSKPVKIDSGTVHINESGGWLDWSGPAVGTDTLIGPAFDLAAGASKAFSRDYGWGMGPSAFVADLRAKHSGQTQRSRTVYPIAKAGSKTPPTIDVSHSLYIGLWPNPAEIFPLWLDDKETLWISLAGQIVNTTGGTARLAAWHATLTVDGKNAIDRDLDLVLWTIDDNGTNVVSVASDGAVPLKEIKTFFAFGFTLPKVSKSFKKATLSMYANYKAGGACGTCFFKAPARFLDASTIASPVTGLAAGRYWNFGNGPNHNGIDAHEWPGERYAYDIGIVDDSGSTHDKTDTASMQDNNNYYCYGKPVHAVKKGKVVGADDTQPENSGNKTNPAATKSNNYVLIQHDDGSMSGYYHLRQGKNKVKSGDSVKEGDEVAKIGNAGGSSEPHLHFGYVTLDQYGHGAITPTIFKAMTTKAGKKVTAVPATGPYKV